MINFDLITNEDNKIHKPNQPQIPDHSYRILTKDRSG